MIPESHQDWTVPVELQRPLPRPVRFTGQGFMAFVMCVFFMAAPAFIIVLSLRDDARAASDLSRMAAEGRATDAVVTRLWVSHGSKGSTSWHVAYDYDVDGRSYSSQNGIARSHWEELQVGGRLPVTYLASDPSHVYPAADPPRRISPLLWCFLALFTSLFAAIGVAVIAGALRSRKLLAAGMPAPARVTNCRKIQSRNGVFYRIRYEFKLMDGRACEGKDTLRRHAPEGSSVTVLYDPDQPRRNAAYPMTMARLAEP